jgi:vacuolar protein sorting-associated protein 13A/C
MTQSYVQTEIVKSLIQALTREAFKLLLRVDIFRPATGTRSGDLARRMGGSALIGVGDSVLGDVSRVPHAAETAKAGAKAVGQGFLRGVTGIAMGPVNLGKERGAIGAFMGIGKGIVGLVTKPVRGILDGGAGAMVALRKVVNGEDYAGVSARTDPHTHR